MKKMILWLLVALFASAVVAQNQNPSELIIEGKSSLKIVPEQFLFNVYIKAENMNYTECTNDALKKADKIIAEFTKAGVDKDLIKTLNYSIRERNERNFQTNETVFKGYRAEIPVVIKTRADNPKNDKIFEIIKNNFNADFTLNFALTSEQKEKAKAKLIAMAIEDAKQKAEIIKESSGVKTFGIRQIQYGEPKLLGAYARPSFDIQNEKVMIRGASSVSSTSVLNPFEVEMRTSIIVSWKI